MEALLWFAVASILYTYAGYPVLLFFLSSLRQLRSDWAYVSHGRSRRAAAAATPPSVAVLVAAFNEERHIGERIRNLLAAGYPADRLRIYVGSDGSDDRTSEILRSIADTRLVFIDSKFRRGKPSVINDLAAMASEDILVFTDANTEFAAETVSHLVRHFDDQTVGCVSGELRLTAEEGGENLDHVYWRYERLLKFHEARIDALLGANGGVYAVRRRYYRAVPADTIVDDFWISMEVIRSGKRCVYDPEAVALERVPARVRDEFRRRVRIGIGNYQALVHFAPLMHPKAGYLALAFFSHKVLRWMVPHLMIAALVANAALCTDSFFYGALLAAQIAFYGAAAAGHWQSRRGTAAGTLRMPLFFVAMNLALLLGFWRYVSGQYSGAWARTAR